MFGLLNNPPGLFSDPSDPAGNVRQRTQLGNTFRAELIYHCYGDYCHYQTTPGADRLSGSRITTSLAQRQEP
jgi:hypothetical protein